MKVGDDRQLVRDPLDHHVLGLNHPGDAQLLPGLEGQLAVVLDVVLGQRVVGDQVRVETVNQTTEGETIPPTGREVCHLKMGIIELHLRIVNIQVVLT